MNYDSTFIISTCSYNAAGNWNVKNDSLILHYASKEAYDSNSESYKDVENSIMEHKSFYVKDKKLIQYVRSGNENCIKKLKKD